MDRLQQVWYASSHSNLQPPQIVALTAYLVNETRTGSVLTQFGLGVMQVMVVGESCPAPGPSLRRHADMSV